MLSVLNVLYTETENHCFQTVGIVASVLVYLTSFQFNSLSSGDSKIVTGEIKARCDCIFGWLAKVKDTICQFLRWLLFLS